ncbi:TonB-dependent receptor [Caulobacter sp. RHG1]|uniref:TonB-dependent receptor n=1 Tax=Caulobacter sp. (strain RHG1) TaxID=2545762 RepID=UPI0015521992|nr:TonB-dependent receptor [Caulobacter sp. RHG1]NQE63601.1 TonB-dependent receptor [Caulobacter sp. RHG1]
MTVMMRKGLMATTALVGLFMGGAAMAQSADQALAVQLEEVVVTGRSAVDTPVERIKAAAPVIVDAITAEEIDKTADLSLPELLERLPSVNSTGFYGSSEAGYANIRGFDSRYNSLDVDGNPILFSSQNNRGAQSGMFPAAIVKEAAVYKTLTPDMDANSIGGHISLRTLRAFDGGTKSYLKATYRVGLPEHRSGVFDGASNQFAAAGKFTFGPERQYGFVFGFNRQRTADYDDFGSVLGYAQVAGPDGVTRDQVNSNVFADSRYDKTVRNTAAFAKLEMRREDALYAFLSANIFDEQRDMYQQRAGAFIANTGGRTVSQTGKGQATFTNAQGQIREFDYDMQRNAKVVGAGLDYRVMARGSISLRGNYTAYGNDTLTRNLGNGFRLASFNGAYDINGDAPVIRPSDTALYDNSANWVFSSAATGTYQRVQPLRDKIATLGGVFNYNNQPDSRGLGVSSGLSWVRLDRTFDQNLTNYTLNKGVTLNLSQVTPAGATMAGNRAAHDSYDAFWAFMANPANAAQTFDASATADYALREDVLALHGAAYYAVGDVRLMAGLRYERTSDATDTSQLVAGVIKPQSREHDYDNWLPSLHLTYEPLARLKVRAAVSKTIGRPDFQDFAPGTTTTFDASGVPLVRGSNPTLGPRVSTNYDASLEYYLDDGLLAVAVFRKDIDGETFSQRSVVTDASGQIVQINTIPLNTGAAEVTGLEFTAAKRRLDMLPAPFDRLGISANYTRLQGEWNVVFSDGSTRSVGGLRGQPRWLANLALSYDAGPLDLRLSYKKQGRTFTGTFGANALTDVWIRPYERLDLHAALRLRRQIQLTFDAKNLGDSYSIQSTGLEDSLSNALGAGRSYWLGLRFNY